MPELGPYGSVRGARGNSRPYRESNRSPLRRALMTRCGNGRLNGEHPKPSYCSTTLSMPADYLRSIELLIVIVLGCMRWKSAQAHQVRQ